MQETLPVHCSRTRKPELGSTKVTSSQRNPCFVGRGGIHHGSGPSAEDVAKSTASLGDDSECHPCRTTCGRPGAQTGATPRRRAHQRARTLGRAHRLRSPVKASSPASTEPFSPTSARSCCCGGKGSPRPRRSCAFAAAVAGFDPVVNHPRSRRAWTLLVVAVLTPALVLTGVRRRTSPPFRFPPVHAVEQALGPGR